MWAGSVLVPVQDPDLDLDQVLDLDIKMAGLCSYKIEKGG